jgi:hypothetical protein
VFMALSFLLAAVVVLLTAPPRASTGPTRSPWVALYLSTAITLSSRSCHGQPSR